MELLGLTIAVVNMKEMLDFYSSIFQINFSKKILLGSELFEGEWKGFKILLCPAHIAKISATQNRHQFDILVEDLDSIISMVDKLGGSVMGEISENGSTRTVGIYDPDQNSFVLTELLSEKN